jgi:transposase
VYSLGMKRDHKEMERRRVKSAGMFEKGMRVAEVARKLGVTRQSAHAWQKSWEAKGSTGLKSLGRAGRKSRLTAKQEDVIVSALLAGPVAAGYQTDMWTLPRVVKLIKAEVGVEYHPGHVWHLLRRLNFSCQRPTRRAIERDEPAITQWKRRTWPTLKKRPGKKAVPSSSLTKAD